jgi:RND superfamily putative drug exporter
VSGYSLEVSEGALAGTTIDIGHEPFLIGRAEDGLGKLGDDPELSRRHARIFERDGDLFVEDLGSMNGTYVNGRRVGGVTPLRPGDGLLLGSTTLRVVERKPAEAAAPPAARVVLEIVTGPAAGRRVPLGLEPLVIGRGEPGPGGLGLDMELSRLHARFFLSSGRLAVADLASTNGTFVNGHRIVYPTVIEPGDVISVGASAIRVVEGPAQTPTRASRAAVSAVHRVRRAETGLLARFGGLAARHPKQMLAGAAAVLVLGVAVGAPVVGKLEGSPQPDPDAESTLAEDRLEQASGMRSGIGLIALVRGGAPVESSRTRAKVRSVVRTLERDPSVARVLDFYTTRNEAFVSRDRASTYVGAVFKDREDDEVEEAADSLRGELEKQPGVLVGGGELIGKTVGDIVGEDLAKAEQLAFPILFLASVLVFRGLVAALLPLLVGVIAIFGTLLALRFVNGTVTGISVFALNMVIAVGLGLAIDYSLFVVSRYREEAARLGHGEDAVRRTVETAGRTIIFSALTVTAALATLLIFPQSFIYSMGLGGAACSFVAVCVALLVLPAVLSLLGPRIDALSVGRRRREVAGALSVGPRRPEVAGDLSAGGDRPEGAGGEDATSGFWYRLSRFVMRRPVPLALVSAVLLIALGLPFLRLELTGIDVTLVPQDENVRRVDDIIQREFPSNQGRQVSLAVEAPPSAKAEVERYARGLRDLAGVAEVPRPRQLGRQLWQVDVVPRFGDLDERTQDFVRSIRERAAPFPVSVTGTTAAFIDDETSIQDHLPLALGLLAAATAVILFVMTGSVLIPLKTLLMNVLTVSAALGLLVLIFQDGRLEGLLGYESQGGINVSQPLLLFAIAFGLSTDYAIFLLTRIKEARDGGASEEESVAIGLERTGRIVTAAALLFSIAVGAFVTSQIIFAKQLGVGTVVAVVVDATIVRALLVPSLMAMLGRRNWWAPRPLRRIHNRVGLSEA